MKTRRVTVGDLKDQTGTKYPRASLYCRKCGAEYSANAGDYWNAPKSHVFKCCERNMVLAVKECRYVEVCNG